MKVKMRKNNVYYLDSERLILAVKNRVRSYSATPLKQLENNCIKVKELSNNIVTSQLVLDDDKVFLVITSTLFHQLKMFVGKVRKSDILLSDNHCLVAGLQVYKLCQMLVNNDEICVNPMSLFNITQHTEESEF